ncbi:MAG: chromosomal replication initiator protein DnaA [Acidaminococcaceae bacterium]|nr:chromosomal replication initiator protein DnaA [Acidaminococcaceae bacterium]MBR1493618.1 chromosomal replication initiator protein DnaA [Acidaminococcaceae bacterium]
METYDLPEIWNKLTEKLSHSTSETNMNMYIRQITPVKMENNIVHLTVPSSTLRTSINQQYLPIIIALLNEITNNENLSVKIDVENHNILNVVKENYETKPLFRVEDKNREYIFESNINKKQRFETFVIGNSNRFATAAAQAVAKNPGNIYNPLFIYGNSGLGKTHLMHAIGNAILESDPDAKVKYVTSETFTNEIINAIQNHTVKDFQEKYRTIDCLIIDDIQFLENKERTQEEFFHTFNALKESNKQIVISSDRHPQNMDKLEERLRSRFVNGLTVDIQPPDLETRIAILRKKAELEHIDMPNDVIQSVATSIDNNIRMIEGAFNRIVAYADLMHLPIDMKMTATVLESFGSHTRQNITIENIIKYICTVYGLQEDDILGKKRPKNIALARQVAMYLCRKMTDASLPKIGSSFGGRDHTTVIHACEKIDKMKNEDKGFEAQLQQFEEKIRSL